MRCSVRWRRWALQAQGAACALRGAGRYLRGIRQPRPAGLHGPPGRADRQAVAGGLPGFRLRQLRPAVVHHLAARPRRWQPDREGALEGVHSGDASGHRAVELPHHPPAAVATGGTKTPAASWSTGCMSRSPPNAARRPRRLPRCWAPRWRQIPVPARDDADGRRPAGARAQPHLAACVVDHRRRRHPPLASANWQRAAPAPALKLSLRLPPTLDGKRGELLQDVLLR